VPSPPTGGHGYDYDGVGNRIGQTGDHLVSFGYPPDGNRLDSINGLPQNFDANGSLTASPTVQQLIHDVRGRLVQADAGGVTSIYQIDALGRRIRKTNPTGDILFHYDLGGRLIAETTAGGILLKEYLYLNDLSVAVVAQ